MWRSGSITKIIELWRRSGERNDFGELSENWSKIKNIRSRSYVKRGRQTTDSDEEFDTRTIDTTIRNQIDIFETDRLKYYGNFYNIDSIIPDDTERWLRIRASKINE